MKVYETFGPTSQPLYQIKFSQAFPLNREIVTVSRAVYHVPDRSNFVFASQLKVYKGSDASNCHDEEVGEEELEFSDDEAEAAFKRSRKRYVSDLFFHKKRRNQFFSANDMSLENDPLLHPGFQLPDLVRFLMTNRHHSQKTEYLILPHLMFMASTTWILPTNRVLHDLFQCHTTTHIKTRKPPLYHPHLMNRCQTRLPAHLILTLLINLGIVALLEAMDRGPRLGAAEDEGRATITIIAVGGEIEGDTTIKRLTPLDHRKVQTRFQVVMISLHPVRCHQRR